MIQRRFALPRLHFRVVSFLFRHVLPVHQRKRIIAVGTHITGIYREACTLPQFLPPSDRGRYISERAAPDTCQKSRSTISFEVRFFRFDVQYAGRRIQTGRLQQVFALTDGKRKHRHIVQRKTSDVYLPCLAVADCHTVVADSRMGCTHVADRDCLQSAYTTVILYVGTGKTAYGIRHILYAKLADVLLRHGLHRHSRCHLVGHPTGSHRHFLYLMHLAGNRIFLHFLCHHPAGHHAAQYDTAQSHLHKQTAESFISLFLCALTAFLEQTIFRLCFAGLLTRFLMYRLPILFIIRKTVASEYDTFLLKHTAAGLSGIHTRFPFHPHLRTEITEQNSGKCRNLFEYPQSKTQKKY
ncbi:unknown [Bacteroides sp. CAG:633]|nr:unknown [Bacteroides sp. CAG:633]